MVSVLVGKHASVTYWHWFRNVAFKSTFLQWERIWSRINSLTLLNGPKSVHNLIPENYFSPACEKNNNNQFTKNATIFARVKKYAEGTE